MNIKKVYIQDHFPIQIADRLKSIRPDLNDELIKVLEIPEGQLDQFHLPFEI